MYTFENLKEDVAKEAQALKVYATKEELGKLSIKYFSNLDRHSCIYGLTTGDCHSKRAATLISKCAPRYFKNKKFTCIIDEGFDGVVSRLNGERVKNFIAERTSDNIVGKHFSPIEAYILLPEAKNANLIAYLKGEVETLEL